MPEIDLRETFEEREEALRVGLLAHQRTTYTSLRVTIAQDSTDGHTCVAQPVIQMNTKDMDGNITQIALPQLPDLPIGFMGGGGVTSTHPISQGDEGTVHLAAHPIDVWHQQGGTQQPIDTRTHSLSDGTYVPGGRSDPRMLQQVSTVSHQIRSDDKKNVIDHHPQNGTTVQAVDPSTQPASESFDPFSQATTFYNQTTHPTNGLAGNATSNGVTHAITNTHTSGPTMSAQNGAHTVNANPTSGVIVQSTIAHTIQAPNASLDAQGNLTNQGSHQAQGPISSAVSMGAPTGTFASGSIGGFGFGGGAFSGFSTSGFGSAILGFLNGSSSDSSGNSITSAALAPNAASGNVGQLSGDLTGTLPNPRLAAGKAAASIGALSGDLGGTLPSPTVERLGNADFTTGNLSNLPQYNSYHQAKTAGLSAGSLYTNPTISSTNDAVLCVMY